MPVVKEAIADDPEATRGCQQGVHTKGFTGKGEAQALHLATKDVDNIHLWMQELSEQTKKIPAKTFYLTVHRRSPTGQNSLRWRSAGSAPNTHLKEKHMETLFGCHPLELANWYRDANKNAKALNQMEQLARARLRNLERDK
jgi:hypothetical protein